MIRKKRQHIISIRNCMTSLDVSRKDHNEENLISVREYEMQPIVSYEIEEH